MSHYRIEDWVDFVRGLGEVSQTAAMKGHLAAGCPECATIVARLQRTAAGLTADAARPVPEAVVARARAVFQPAQAPWATGQRLSRLLAELVFDSWSAPAPAYAGIRGSLGTRQLSYRAGDVRLDLSVEPVPKSPRLLFTGQVHGKPAGNSMTVKILCGERTVSESTTSEFGEFALESPNAIRLSLHIENLRGGFGIMVPLTPLLTAALDTPTTELPENKK